LIACALALFERERVKRAIRLMGFGVSNLVASDQAMPAQLELFAELSGRGQDGRNKKIDKAVDALRHSFGSNAIKRERPIPVTKADFKVIRDKCDSHQT
jgi:hypothetical protein